MWPLVMMVVSGLPSPAPLEPPMAQFAQTLLRDSMGSTEAGDTHLFFKAAESCPQRYVSTLGAMSGALSALERLQQWLAKNPGVEVTLYGRAGALAQVFTHVSKSAISNTKAPCTLPKTDEWRLVAPLKGKLCESQKPLSTVERWLVSKQGVVAAGVLADSAEGACAPRLSIALFDTRGALRVILNADFGGAMSAQLVGDRCRLALDYDATAGVFRPEWKNCKG